MVRELRAEDLVDQVAADSGRVRFGAITAAIAGRRRALAAIDEHLPASHRSPYRMLRYLTVVLVWLAGYTGLLHLGWADASGWALAGLIVVLGGIAWLEHRHAPPAPPARDVPVHVGFADDPAALEQQLAALRPPPPATEPSTDASTGSTPIEAEAWHATEEILAAREAALADNQHEFDEAADEIARASAADMAWLEQRAAAANRALAAITWGVGR